MSRLNRIKENPTQKIMRVAMSERYAPELLQWEGQLVEDVLERLHQQVCFCAAFDALIHPTHLLLFFIFSLHSHLYVTLQNQMVEYLRSDDATSEDEHFRMSYVQLDMERVKFQIRSYVRTRLHKVS